MVTTTGTPLALINRTTTQREESYYISQRCMRKACPAGVLSPLLPLSARFYHTVSQCCTVCVRVPKIARAQQWLYAIGTPSRILPLGCGILVSATSAAVAGARLSDDQGRDVNLGVVTVSILCNACASRSNRRSNMIPDLKASQYADSGLHQREARGCGYIECTTTRPSLPPLANTPLQPTASVVSTRACSTQYAGPSCATTAAKADGNFLQLNSRTTPSQPQVVTMRRSGRRRT